MSSVADCIRNNRLTADGVKISGHDFRSLIAVKDIDTKRSYFIDECISCGYFTASFATDKIADIEISRYPKVRKVGGERK